MTGVPVSRGTIALKTRISGMLSISTTLKRFCKCRRDRRRNTSTDIRRKKQQKIPYLKNKLHLPHTIMPRMTMVHRKNNRHRNTICKKVKNMVPTACRMLFRATCP